MANEPKLPTAQEYIEFAGPYIEGRKFSQAHVNEYNPVDGPKLGAYVRGKNLPWTEENLTAAFEALKEAGELTPLVYAPPAEETPVAEVPEAEETFPWGARLTTAAIQSMSSADFAKWNSHRNWGATFKQQILDAQEITPYTSPFRVTEKP